MCSDGFSLTPAVGKKKRRQERPLGTQTFLDFVLAVVRGVFTWKGILGISG